MTYKEGDWQRALRRLQSARQSYLDYKNLDKKTREPDLLDDSITKCWSFGEYAINVCIECIGGTPPQNHSQATEAEALFNLGHLTRDYSAILTKLEAFRKKAAHLGYAKERSTHYSSADVDRCLTEMEALSTETETLLRKRHPR